ncbi:MAG: glycosyltransferase family 2 protein [Actinobacteria bacterium]|nr:glycosyltransferase family 2 protein [Actinomycetota bacterium]
MAEVGVRMDEPRIRVVVLNFNGGEMVVKALEHLVATDYPRDRIQVICVDNCSTDGSVALIEQRLPQVEVRSNESNLGFPGNNTALTDLDTFDYVALINSDAFVERDWLRPLVEAAEGELGLGAVCPKILLAPQFLEVSIRMGSDLFGTSEVRGQGVIVRGVRSEEQDVFVESNLGATGWGREADKNGVFEWSHRVSKIRIPVASTTADVVKVSLLLEAPEIRTVSIDGGCGAIERPVGKIAEWFEIDVRGESFDVLNNVGSSVLGDGYGVDNGYLERDNGQFDEPCDVFAWCGGAVLLRTAYLRDVGLFDELFFLYYEDTDLSWRGALRGWRYRTVPQSRVRHLHAASSIEASAVFARYTERNRLLMLFKNAPAPLVFRQIIRFVLITGSYVRRDVLLAVLHGRKPNFTTVCGRLASLFALGALTPKMVGKRRAIRSQRLVQDPELQAKMMNLRHLS